jgi:hypothetical protein
MSITASRIDTWKPKQADYRKADGGVQSTFLGTCRPAATLTAQAIRAQIDRPQGLSCSFQWRAARCRISFSSICSV